MSECVVYTPPKRKIHDLDYTHERILLSGSRLPEWKHNFITDISACEVEVFDPLDNIDWELEHSHISTFIPVFLDTTEDAHALTIVGKHMSSGKLVVCCTESFPYRDQVWRSCQYDGATFVHTFEEMVDTILARLNQPRKYRKLVATSD